MKTHVGIVVVDSVDDFGDPVHDVGFAASDIDISGDGLAHRAEFRFRFANQFEDFACPLA